MLLKLVWCDFMAFFPIGVYFPFMWHKWRQHGFFSLKSGFRFRSEDCGSFNWRGHHIMGHGLLNLDFPYISIDTHKEISFQYLLNIIMIVFWSVRWFLYRSDWPSRRGTPGVPSLFLDFVTFSKSDQKPYDAHINVSYFMIGMWTLRVSHSYNNKLFYMLRAPLGQCVALRARILCVLFTHYDPRTHCPVSCLSHQ